MTSLSTKPNVLTTDTPLVPGLKTVIAKASILPKRGMLAAIVGPAGVGKSTWAAHWPGVHFVIEGRDEGIINLIYEGLVPVPLENVHRSSDHKSYKSNIIACMNNPACLSIACESLRGIQDICNETCLQMEYQGNINSYRSYQEGSITSDGKYFREILDYLLMAQNRGKHGILIGHTRTKLVKNVGGIDYYSSVLDAEDRIANRVASTFQNIFHINDSITTLQKGHSSAKAQSDTTRVVYTTNNPQYFAKNQMGLVAPFAMPASGKEAWEYLCRLTKRSPKTGFKL